MATDSKRQTPFAAVRQRPWAAAAVTLGVAAGVAAFIAILSNLPQVSGPSLGLLLAVLFTLSLSAATVLSWRFGKRHSLSVPRPDVEPAEFYASRWSKTALATSLAGAFVIVIALVDLPAPWSIVSASVMAGIIVEGWCVRWWFARRSRRGH